MTADLTPEQAYAAAFVAFQSEMPHVGKDQTATVPTKSGGTYSYDYADLTDITDTVLPILLKHGLSWSAAPDIVDSRFVLKFRLGHTEGFAESGSYPLPDPEKSTPQAVGSAITYARRYALCAITGLAPGGDDDEGAKASAPPRPEPRATRTEPTAPTDEPTVARAELAALCKERGWTVGGVAETFAGWDSEHRTIGQADAVTVREFAAKLADGAVVPEGAS